MQVVKVQKRKIVLNFVIIVLCISIGWYLKAKLTPQSNNMALAGGATPHVLVEEVIKTDVSPQRKYIASVEAIKSVDLIPQVSGYVDEVLFQEGTVVKEGDTLFVIEQDRYIANVDLSQAALDSAKANLVKTERDYKRQKALSSQQYASKSTLDTAESAYLQAKAAVAQAEANLELAKIDLEMHIHPELFIGKNIEAAAEEAGQQAQEPEPEAEAAETEAEAAEAEAGDGGEAMEAAQEADEPAELPPFWGGPPELPRPPKAKVGLLIVYIFFGIVIGIPVTAVLAAIALAVLCCGVLILGAAALLASFCFLGMSVVADILLLAGLALVLAALGLLFFCAAIWFFRRCAVGFVDLVIRKGRDWCYEHGKEEL